MRCTSLFFSLENAALQHSLPLRLETFRNSALLDSELCRLWTLASLLLKSLENFFKDNYYMSAVGELTWLNVGAALSLVLVDVGLSKAFDLGVATSLLIASVRCVVQLSFTGILLQAVFLSESPLATALTIFTMLLLAGNEVAMSRIKRKPKYLVSGCHIVMFVDF